METLRLKARPPVEDEIENWDDDDFLIEGEDITINSHSTSAHAPSTSNRRDSHSSFRSDFESVHGEEEKQVLLPGDDEKSTMDAIAAAAKAGIPIPRNVPPSALMGGTIKRLGGRKIKKIIQEDWVDDLEFPDAGQSLQIKPQDESKFPEVLRQVSGGSALPSPSKPGRLSTCSILEDPEEPKPTLTSSTINLELFRDTEEDDDFFGDGCQTIKVAKTREIKPISLVTPPTPQKYPDQAKTSDQDDDFEHDFVLPMDGRLKLSNRRDIPKTPSLVTFDDIDWAEGSLGTRFGGTRRDGRSNRSSSASALSPSIASSLTMESEEDEALDGLVLPSGPVNFEERLSLSRRRQSRSPVRMVNEIPRSAPRSPPKESAPEPTQEPIKEEKEDFLAGLDIGDGEVFDSKKLTLHRNIQVKETRPASPSRPKTTVALKFNRQPTTASRLPRPMGPPAVSHERTHTQSSLEPVSESGGPITHTRRSLSRLGHSAHSSVTSVTSPTTPSSASTFVPTTPRRKEVGQKTSTVSLRDGPTTTSAQLLRLKRSLPAMRAPQSPARTSTSSRGYERPPSRTEMAQRPQSSMRPKTPVERMRTVESAAAQARKPPVPFLPAGASASQSHNVAAKSSRVFRRHDSEPTIDYRPNSRAVSRSTMRSPSPRKSRHSEKFTAGTWQQLSRPHRAKQFGDGHELDGFDDLPTSSQAESRFLKQPVTSGSKPQVRNRLYQNILPDRNMTPSPSIPFSPSRADYVPSFARDTTASRIARETSLAQRAPSGPLAPLTQQRVAQLSARNNFLPRTPQGTIKSKKTRKPPQLKPHLISNLNPPRESKMVKGMYYNPETFRWEGNDNVLSNFEAPASSPSTASVPHYMMRERENATPRPALITNINATKGVQVVGGMVFDPQNMCWLKLGPNHTTGGQRAEENDTLDGFNGIDDDEDVFKDIPDLEDHALDSNEAAGGSGGGRSSELKDDWLVGEEFDVGPEFVRRQREEEERWRKKCHLWFNDNRSGDRGNAWKWAIRDIVSQAWGDA
ncbi:protein byr4 [Rhypophila decipiens]